MTMMNRKLPVRASRVTSTDTDPRQMSSHAALALQEFYAEKDAHQQQFEDLSNQAENDFDGRILTMDVFTEDWNASQFWVRRQ